jgi:hypothetical protein
MRADGDFRGGRVKSIEPFLAHHAYTYANTWLIWAAQLLGRYELVRKALQYLLGFQTPLGGFLSAPNRERMDLLSTAAAIEALVRTGRLEEAVKAGRFLLHVWDAQPEPGRLYTATDPEGQVLLSFPEEEADLYLVDSSSTGQQYFYAGYPAKALATLYAATGLEGFLLGAQHYLAFAEGCAEDRYTHPSSGKLGWAAAYLYTLTRREEYAQIATRVADNLASRQAPEGYWLYWPRYQTLEEQPLHTTIDLTAEFTTWLIEMMGGLLEPGRR